MNNTQITNQTYISAIQGISWIAFSEFDAISKAIAGIDRSVKKWESFDKQVLLKCLYAIKDGKNKPLSEEKWQKLIGSEHPPERASIEKKIKRWGKPIQELIDELSSEVEKETDFMKKIGQAADNFLEELRAETIQMKGKNTPDHKDVEGKVNYEVVPLGYLLHQDIHFDIFQNGMRLRKSVGHSKELNQWNELKVKTADVFRLWPNHKQDKIPQKFVGKATVEKWLPLSDAVNQLEAAGKSKADARKCILDAIESSKLAAQGIRNNKGTLRQIIKPEYFLNVIHYESSNDDVFIGGKDPENGQQLWGFSSVSVDRKQFEHILAAFVPTVSHKGIYTGIKEPLIPYIGNSKLISMSDAKNYLCAALGAAEFWGEPEQLFTDALKSKQVKAIAIKAKDMYELPPVFWEISYLSSYSVGAFNAFWEGVVDNMLDSERIADLHAIHRWAIVIDEDSFEEWLSELPAATEKPSPTKSNVTTEKEIEKHLITLAKKNDNIIPSRDVVWDDVKKHFKKKGKTVPYKLYKAAHKTVRENADKLGLTKKRVGRKRNSDKKK